MFASVSNEKLNNVALEGKIVPDLILVPPQERLEGMVRLCPLIVDLVTEFMV